MNEKLDTDLFMLTEEIRCSYAYSLISLSQLCKWILQMTPWLCVLHPLLPNILCLTKLHLNNDGRILVTDNKKSCRGIRCTRTHEGKQFSASRSKGVTSCFLTVFIFKRLD